MTERNYEFVPEDNTPSQQTEGNYNMTERNYEFVPEDTIKIGGHKLTRIRAIKDIPQHPVNAGDLGGYVERYENLTGNAWVAGNARVYGDARVSGNAHVSGNARVYGNVHVSDNAWVADSACVFDDACVYGNACVHGNAHVYGNASVFDTALVSGNTHVYDSALVYDNAWVAGNAHVYGNACVFDTARVSGNAEIKKTSDVIFIGPAKSSGRFTTAFKDSKIGVRAATGCFSGSIDEFKAAIEETHKDDSECLKQYRGFVATIEATF